MHIRTILKKDSTKSYRAIIKSNGKEFGKTLPEQKLAQQWAGRIEHDAGMLSAHACPGATMTVEQLVTDYKSANRSEWATLPENQVLFWVDHLGLKIRLIEIRKSGIRAGWRQPC